MVLTINRSEPVETSLARDTTSFEAAVRPHQPKMLLLAARLAPRHQPEDIVQDALLRAWRHREQFDSNRGTLSNWLLAITANEAHRAERSWRGLIRSPSPDTSLAVDDRLDVEAALRRLPRRQRLAIDCHYYAGLSVAETAAVMQCAEGTVKSTLADARKHIRQILEVER